MNRRFILDIIISQSVPILQPLAVTRRFILKNETLLMGRIPLLLLNLRLDMLNRIRRLTVQRKRPTGQSLDEDLHISVSVWYVFRRPLKLTGAA